MQGREREENGRSLTHNNNNIIMNERCARTRPCLTLARLNFESPTNCAATSPARAHRQCGYSNSFVTSAVTAAADDVLSSIFKNKQPRGARVL